MQHYLIDPKVNRDRMVLELISGIQHGATGIFAGVIMVHNVHVLVSGMSRCNVCCD